MRTRLLLWHLASTRCSIWRGWSSKNTGPHRIPGLPLRPHTLEHDRSNTDQNHANNDRHKDHVVIALLGEAESQRAVYDSQGENDAAEPELVRFDEPGWLLGFEVDAVVEEAGRELGEEQEVDYYADDLVGGVEVHGSLVLPGDHETDNPAYGDYDKTNALRDHVCLHAHNLEQQDTDWKHDNKAKAHHDRMTSAASVIVSRTAALACYGSLGSCEGRQSSSMRLRHVKLEATVQTMYSERSRWVVRVRA